MKCFHFSNGGGGGGGGGEKKSAGSRKSASSTRRCGGVSSELNSISDMSSSDYGGGGGAMGGVAGVELFAASLSQRSNDLRAFSFSELKIATKNFSRSLVVGEGGFGCVYKGIIKTAQDPQAKLTVAVKQLGKRGLQGHKEWVTEVNVLGVVEHPNLVKLVGYCADDDERGIQRLLIYEYMPNRSVQDHLSPKSSTHLPWPMRLKIAQDAARGLAYLHEEMNFQIIFRDFKASNILLDEQWNAKLSDFGLARLGPTEGLSHVSTAVVGTMGYAAPEYMQTGRLTAKLKLVFSSNGFKSLSRPLLSLYRVASFSTQTLPPTPKTKRDTLYSRISPLGDPRASVVPVLDQWVEEGNAVKRVELVHIIKQLRVYKRYKHSLEISQWMTDRRYLVLSPGDIAVRLDLISKVHGIEHAEKYFDSIPKQLKTYPVYGALLNCYAQRKFVEKAEAIMQQMRELEFTMSSLAYNVLLTLYSKMGQYEKLDALMEEMQEKGVHPDKFTFSIRLSAYIAASDIEGMEKTLWRMSEDPEVMMDWNCYAIAANGYIKAGLIEKGLEMLKNSEELITGKQKRTAYNFLLTMYAAAGRKPELYRLWNLYKSSEKIYNAAYLCMIGSLLKLDDISGAEKIFEEWESGGTSYDFRVPNLLIGAYCKNGNLEKAEKLVINATEKGEVPYPNTWDILASGYVKANQMSKAVKAMKTAFEACRPGWKPNCDTLASIMVYLKQEGDMIEASEFVKFLGSGGHLSTDKCERLQDYIHDKTTEFNITSGMDGNEDTNEITSEMGGDEETIEITKESN